MAKAKKAPAVKEQEERVEIPKISFEAYLQENVVHPGLVASFTVEEGEKMNESRTSEEWKNALEAQSNKRY